jgi:hypothetical protein
MLTMGFGLGYFHRKGKKLFVKGWICAGGSPEGIRTGTSTKEI